MSPDIPHSRPCLGPEELRAVWRVLESKQLAQGPEVEAFERELGALHRHPALAVSTGTAALHLGLVALGARRVAIPSYACVSLLNAVKLAGAEPVVLDCESPDRPEAAFDAPDADVCLVPHMFGRLSRLPRGKVLEDATHALGVPGVGNGNVTAYSFHATKMLAGGEGGALVFRSQRLLETARDLRSYDGRSTWKLRYNYKLTDLQAALLRVQLSKLERFLARRRQLVEFYHRELPMLRVLPNTLYRFVVLHPDRLPFARRPVFRPIHRYLKLKGFPHADALWRQAQSLPLYPDLTDSEAHRVVEAIRLKV